MRSSIGVAFVFQRSRHRETFASLEKGKDYATTGGRAVFLDQAKFAPGVGRRCGDGNSEIVFELIATPAHARNRFAFGRILQSATHGNRSRR